MPPTSIILLPMLGHDHGIVVQWTVSQWEYWFFPSPYYLNVEVMRILVDNTTPQGLIKCPSSNSEVFKLVMGILIVVLISWMAAMKNRILLCFLSLVVFVVYGCNNKQMICDTLDSCEHVIERGMTARATNDFGTLHYYCRW